MILISFQGQIDAMDWIRESVTVKYLFESDQELERILDVYDEIRSHELVSQMSDEPSNPQSANLTVESELGFWEINAYNHETPPEITIRSESTNLPAGV